MARKPKTLLVEDQREVAETFVTWQGIHEQAALAGANAAISYPCDKDEY